MLSIRNVLLSLCWVNICFGKYLIPDVTLEAFFPMGFRASIPADSETELFAFHGKLNEQISRIERGDFNGDVKSAKNGVLTYYNPNLKLSVGDVIHYWVFVQHNQLGFRKEGLNWTVDEVRPEPGAGCEVSITKVSDKLSVCKGAGLFEDNFSTLDNEKWVLEQYLPAYPDYEFVLYKRDQDVLFINDNKLCIKPKVKEDRDELTKIESISSEFGDGCTRPANCHNQTYLIKNPVVSARLESKVTFTYGVFEVKAKVPVGDWIYPEIYLEDNQARRIYIAYTRGNKDLTGASGDDLGNSLLFGGPVSKHKEPARSSKLSSYKSDNPLSTSSHVYKLRWTQNTIELFIDNQRYGEIQTESDFTGSNKSGFKLVLGVGVGGLHDFPNDYKSGEYTKPWVNYKPTQVLDFFNSKSKWLPTWTDEGRQLQVEYVKVTAI